MSDDPAEPQTTGRRSRRARTKVIDYAKEQEFSDADLFEDVKETPAAPNTATKKKKAKGGRKSKSRKSTSKKQQQQDDFAENPFEDDDEYEYVASKPVYTEKGYDPTLPPIRDRFPFLPEYELDGSPRIELIVGRRPVDEKDDNKKKSRKDDDTGDEDDGFDTGDNDDDDEEDLGGRKRRGRGGSKKRGNGAKKSSANDTNVVEYEYLVKYKNLSYLHLEWKSGADLESMNKSAKTMYRRYLKKVTQGQDDELENPEFDPSFVVVQKVLAEEEQELELEVEGEELLKWEKQREKELAEEDLSEEEREKEEEKQKEEEEKAKEEERQKEEERLRLEKEAKSAEEAKEDGSDKKGEEAATDKDGDVKMESASEEKKDDASDDWRKNDIDFKELTIEKLRSIVDLDGPYYPTVEGSDNAYRDGYITEPPKKPRASYLFFQCSMRSYFSMRNPNATNGELMTILGEQWASMSEQGQEPFLELAKEEYKQYERERALMEKAQKPNEMWQPIRRCRMVWARLVEDGFANIFLEPVNLEDFPDYEEMIDHPMDLQTVRTKLDNRKYQMPEQFARDMRKIWNNCKIYNRHGSAIWHVADYMSKQFERLYHAWVMAFRERYLRWANPRARPWENTCRITDGKCKTKEDDLVLCDHCDAPYGIKCLKPPLAKLPTGVWHCPDCAKKLRSGRGVQILSAMSEQAARKRAEYGEVPTLKVKRTMYLVKWSGLGYEHCTWESKEDVGSPELIAEYHKLNHSSAEEPCMSEEAAVKVLTETEHINRKNAGGSTCIPELRTRLYAQTRAFQFTKFGLDVPGNVRNECGPMMKAAHTQSPVESEKSSEFKEILQCVNDLTERVALQGTLPPVMKLDPALPPLLTGEYDAVVPITAKGLMMNVGEIQGSVAFLGYRQFPNGSKGPAELKNLLRGPGDKIIAVNGVSTVNKSFKDVIGMLRDAGKKKFAIIRFLESRYATIENDLTSYGSRGQYTLSELKKKFSTDRQRLLVQRKVDAVNESKEDEEQEENKTKGSEEEEDSEGEFQPDSDDEMEEEIDKNENSMVLSDELKRLETHEEFNLPKAETVFDSPKKMGTDESDKVTDAETKPNEEKQDVVSSSYVQAKQDAASGEDVEVEEKEKVQIPKIQYENTHSLAYRLLNLDVGYSSDEGGDEDGVFYVDGMDDTFTSQADIQKELNIVTPVKEEKKDGTEKAGDDATESLVPVKRNEFSSLGDRSKLLASVAVTSSPPDVENFDENFPFESKKSIAAKEAAKLAEAKKAEEEAITPGSPEKVKRSTVKIEQISPESSEVLNVWANVEIAAATLQLPLNELKRVLRGDLDEDFSDEVGGFRWGYAASGAVVTTGETSRKGSKKGKEAWNEFRDRLYDPSEPHKYKNNNRLRDYQVEGVNWLASTFYRKHGCILADEMGLGKTVQIVSYLEHLFRVEKLRGPFLVVVPLSTVEHWRREFEGWTEMVCCVYHDRQRQWRDVLREYEWYYEDKPRNPEFLKFHVLVTTYDTLIGDFDVIGQIPFRVAVVDEAHRLRNQKGKLLECMKEISAKGTLQHGYQSRVLMSGTPLQNDLSELWTLLNFIEPFKFPDIDNFLHYFGNMKSKEQVENLQQKISPFMLRRVKEDVAKDIPAKEETVIDVELTSIQKQYYRAIFEHNHAFLNMGATRVTAPKLMNIQMELRKVCNHPCLLDGVEHREQDRVFKEFLESGKFEGKSPEEQQYIMNEHLQVQTSGKMVLMDKLLPKLRQEGHKILIFSQMVKMLDLISEYCEFREYPYERLDGRVRGTDRQKSIDRFNKEANAFLFLLSTRAGGVGINLTAADICIIFDSDWNPQNDVQAQARCHRIGQTKDVRIYRLVTSRTFEQEMFDRASKKLGLEQAVLGSFGQDEDDDKPTSKEMEQLLKRGAYALLEDDNDKIEQFCADDIDNILATRTRTRVVEGAKTASWLNKQGMVVSKSKFTSDTKSADLDMNDPLFWQKVMPDFITPMLMIQQLQDLSHEILGTVKKVGRGRGRWKKKHAEEEAKKEEARQAEQNGATETPKPEEPDSVKETENAGDDVAKDTSDEKKEEGSGDKEEGAKDSSEENKEEEDSGDKDDSQNENTEDDDGKDDDAKEKEKFQLTKTQKRKIAKFMSDLKSMMEGLFDEAADDNLPAEEKDSAQKLLLTVSVKEKLFNEDQRHYARATLKRLEGNRRRRCRTSGQGGKSTPRRHTYEEDNIEIREELRIVSSKKMKRRRRKGGGDEEQPERKRKKSSMEIGDDGYKIHSDDEADWSDIDDDVYGQKTKKNVMISMKEAKRRRQWAADGDAAVAAGRPWPALPRTEVAKVLKTLLDEVLKHDEAKGGVFSVPVPRDEFPDYYDQVKIPMDYGTMKNKLENEEYRSAQAMQKDFRLVMQNCLQFNAYESEICQEARQQALMRPGLLRAAAMANNLFLAEDGSVLQIVDEKKTGTPVKKRKRRTKEEMRRDAEAAAAAEAAGNGPVKKKRGRKKKKVEEGLDLGVEDDDVPLTSMKKKKPRIKINLRQAEDKKNAEAADEEEQNGASKEKDNGDNVVEPKKTPVPRKKRGRKSATSEKVAESTSKKIVRRRNPKQRGSDSNDIDFLNVALLKTEREALDLSYDPARKFFTARGAWVLPEKLTPSKFRDVALAIFKKLQKIDRYDVFKDPVTVEQFPDYFEIVKNPIDLTTMGKKVESGAYGEGTEAASKLYSDFLLMFDNCRLYNDDETDVTEEAARIMALIPELYGSVCASVLKKQK